MPATEAAARLTDGYRSRLLTLRRGILVALVAAWALEENALDATFGLWLGRAVMLLGGAQADAVRLSDAYSASYVSAETGEAVRPVGLDPADYAGSTVDGRPLAALLAGALIAVKADLGAGKSFNDAAAAGRARGLRNASYELDAAGDAALTDALDAQPRIRGWRRVTSGRPCGACLASADGKLRSPRAALLRHPHCRCTKEPAVDGAAERIRRPTGAQIFERLSPREQNALFAGRGGAAKADAIRSGRASIEDLVVVDRMDSAGREPMLTEAPLERLAR